MSVTKKNLIFAIADFLETYSGRDKILKLLSYAARLSTITTSSEQTQNKLKYLGSDISESRMLLRLLDDCSLLRNLMEYGLGKESDGKMRWLHLSQHVTNMAFCIIEHIYWAGTRKILIIDLKKWNLIVVIMWIITIKLALWRMLHKIKCMSAAKKNPKSEMLTCIRLMLDLGFAINYLPKGILWGERLNTWQVGGLGTMSALIGIYQAVKSREQIVAAKKE